MSEDDYKKGFQEGYREGYRDGAAVGRSLPKEHTPYTTPVMPSNPVTIPTVFPDWSKSMTCSECGMVWKGAMGYVCPNQKCPIQPKITNWSVGYTTPGTT